MSLRDEPATPRAEPIVFACLPRPGPAGQVRTAGGRITDALFAFERRQSLLLRRRAWRWRRRPAG